MRRPRARQSTQAPRRRSIRRTRSKHARVQRCQDGADVVCPCGFRLRLRVCMDGRRRVHVLGTAAIDGTLVRATVTERSVRVTPRKHAARIRRCVAKARPALEAAKAAYLKRFSPAVRHLVRVA